MQCNCKLAFDNDISIEVKSKKLYQRSVLGHIFERIKLFIMKNKE